MENTELVKIYRNVMEDLVKEELDHQSSRLPAKLREFICVAEVTAFALNRLPALYATSEKGWRQQRLRGKQELTKQIATVVRQALAAIQCDPLRVSTPIHVQPENTPAYALGELKKILLRDDLTWETAADVVEAPS
jgi:Late competence development protein ComFB